MPVQGVSFYANYSESFNLLLVRAFTVDGQVLDPESATQYEGGVKLYLLDGALSSTIAIYRIIKKMH